MANVQLGRAVLALLADPSATQVVIPSLSAITTSWTPDKTFARFVGDKHDTAFHGEGELETFALSCMFARKYHAELAAFLHLIRVTARAAPDKRLLLRTHVGLAPGLNESVAVELDGQLSYPWTAAAVTVQLPVRVVEYDPAA